jgi:hypothetical protein
MTELVGRGGGEGNFLFPYGMYEKSLGPSFVYSRSSFYLYRFEIFVFFDNHCFASAISAPAENKRTEHVKDDGLPVDIKLPVKHILSRELQVL